MTTPFFQAAFVLMTILVVPPVEALDDIAKREVEKIVREYIVNHPDVIVESIQALQARLRAERARTKEVIDARRGELLGDAASPVGGNHSGDVTVVQFFDYQCGYCKDTSGALKQLVAGDPNVRIVYKEFPIEDPTRWRRPRRLWLPEIRADTWNSTRRS